MNFMEIYEELNHASNFFKKFNPLFLYGILIRIPIPSQNLIVLYHEKCQIIVDS
jgi:hypothetical protein